MSAADDGRPSALWVYLELGGDTVLAGKLYPHLRRGSLSSTFNYDLAYLTNPSAYALDPELPLAAGSQPVTSPLPRSFLDASPDRWGRNLIRKRVQHESRQGHQPLRTLDERDFLLSVADVSRQGALRFALREGGAFQHPGQEVPKLVSIPELLAASVAVANDAPDNQTAIKRLLDAGSASLGGARPKASVMDGRRLLLAKFPHPNDEWDVIRCEATALDLAQQAGLSVPRHRLIEINAQAVLLLDRFDRADARIGYQSAMTLLRLNDGDVADYLDVADQLALASSAPTDDLASLFRHVAFVYAINSTDDHLRNLGLLRTGAGWRLAPSFDLNPSPSSQHMTSVSGQSTLSDGLAALRECAEAFDLTKATADRVLTTVRQVVAQWPSLAAKNGVPPGQIEYLAQFMA
ncbi:MAG: HipA domain-containing protein [Propionibacteriaceae bacterium]|jgi:serine/threonine-protein kinase HipA|nr:HipA domain-containing protein [Propionibacteriaceae bacterium]